MVRRVERLTLLLIISLGAACTSQTSEIEIPFSVLYNGEPLSCNEPAAGTSMTDLRFYVYDFHLLASDGREIPIALSPDDFWQTEAVALLDFENGKGACINGSERTNTIIRGRYEPAEIQGLSFRVGVPEILNHEDALTAEAPLNFTDMHWHWASGYKFLRAGVETGTDGFWIHLGSSRCEGTIGDIQGCRAANRPNVIIAKFTPGQDQVAVDLGELFSGIDFSDGTKSDCSSGPAESTCAAPFDALGIDFESGNTVSLVRAIRGERIE